MPWILNHIDCFVSQSRGNARVEEVIFYPFLVYNQEDDVWDKLGEAIGNLQALKSLGISSLYCSYFDEDCNDQVEPDWGKLERILSHVWQKVEVEFHDDQWDVEDVQAFAGAIRGHPTITRFDSGEILPYESMDSLYSVMATLPALESITLCTLANPESLTQLLRVPSLRSVCFYSLFTPADCQAIANAFIEGAVFPNLEFRYCSFSDGECAAIMANGLARNTSVSRITVQGQGDEAIKKFLAAALPLNSTLQELSFEIRPCKYDPNTPSDWSPIFLALGKNSGLKSLKVGGFGSMGESLCTAMTEGFGLNETLESLELTNAILCDDDDVLCDDSADLWSRALSFLRTNKALKSLVVNVQHGATDSSLSALYIDIAAMLQDSASIESLSIRSSDAMKAKGYVHFAPTEYDSKIPHF
jgi:hypothetical protein